MGVVLGGDYRAARTEDSPAGLVSDPPNYARCVSVSEGIVPKAAGKPALDAARRRVKCHQLNAAIKEQALNYVLSVLWSREEAKELGLRIPSEGEISNRLRFLIYNKFKNPAYFRKVIASERRSLADVRFLIKRNILETQIYARIKARAKRLGGPEQATIYKLVLANNAKWQARTSCSPGYRAWECKEYGSAGEAKPPAAIVLEYFQKGIG